MSEAVPRVVIVGGGFGGPAAAKALGRANVEVILSDRQNHHDVGAGPTGVEMAGAMAVLVRQSLRCEFRRIDPTSARIILVNAGKRVLGAFPEALAAAATRRLETLGVELRLGHAADHVDADSASVAGEYIASKTVIWTAGVTPSPAGTWLQAPTDRAGRVRVQPDLTVTGHPEIFVVGDTASLDQDGHPLPGVAQVAMQQGRYAAGVIRRRITGQAAAKPFRYFDKGTMAVVGKGFAVLHSGCSTSAALSRGWRGPASISNSWASRAFASGSSCSGYGRI
jgi:NADH dehydrogenase FAD-containing subunit